jgi:lipopolysaccharide export system protein LptC
MDKEVEMEKTGKNEYILTSDDVENYSEGDIKKSFDKPFEDEERM